MALTSLFRRSAKTAAASPTGEDASADELRGRARRRLLGAVVLLGIGVVAFPLLFETAPRPIPVDLPIEIPRKDQAPPLAMPASAPAEIAAEPAAAPAPSKPAPEAIATSAPPVAAAGPKEAAAATTPPVATPARPANDGARAKALLEGKPAPTAPAAENGRWVVQIGAFAEDRTVREARAKAEKAGLETYTQIITAQAGKRTRVRVGPFGDRGQADAAAHKLKQAGLPATVLKL